MRDLTEWFQKNLPVELGQITSQLLQIDANVPHTGGVALAGGYLRDLYFGYQPKDMDFVFYGLTEAEFLCAFEMWMARCPGQFEYEVHGDNYNGAKDGLIPVVIKVTYEGRAMDLILYNCDTLTEVLMNFDHSINEFAASYDADFKFTIGHRQGWGVCTRNANCDLTPERVDRMQEYARRVDWEYV